MHDRFFCTAVFLFRRYCLIWMLGFSAWGGAGAAAWGQSGTGAGEAGGCTLKNHVYHCDGEVFAKALLAAETVRIETDNVDGPAQGALKSLLTKKLDKKVVQDDGAAADLAFVMIQTPAEGIVNSPGDAALGTLRVYTVAAGGGWGRLLWAETYAGQQDLPWAAVVHGLIAQFQKDFQIR